MMPAQHNFQYTTYFQQHDKFTSLYDVRSTIHKVKN